ncbi:MAG: hypothetical protein E7620_07185 [Ruminococcaceae bacterium]|nr:hypothetical protein [Oscillospiraceae bacterium]
MYSDLNNDFSTLSSRVYPYLIDREEILWCGQPYVGVRYRPPFFQLIFMIFWFGFAVFWTVTATTVGGFFGLFGIPFLAIGGYTLYALTLGHRRKLKKTVYAVTDRRAIILSSTARGEECVDFLFSNLSGVSLQSVRGNSGTIYFRSQNVYTSYGHRRSAAPHVTASFEMIETVHEVYKLISEKIAEASHTDR